MKIAPNLFIFRREIFDEFIQRSDKFLFKETVLSRILKMNRSEETTLALDPPIKRLNRRTNFNIGDIFMFNNFILFMESSIDSRVEGITIFPTKNILALNSFWFNKFS